MTFLGLELLCDHSSMKFIEYGEHNCRLLFFRPRHCNVLSAAKYELKLLAECQWKALAFENVTTSTHFYESSNHPASYSHMTRIQC